MSTLQSAIGCSEPSARAIASFTLRAIGLGVAGALVSLSLASMPMRIAAPIAVVGAPLVAIASLWVNYGYFPIYAQIELAVASSVLGALAGLALRRSWIALGLLIALSVGLFVWGTATGISDELYEMARATGEHLLDDADAIPDGDEGFAALVREAFVFAEDNSHGTDASLPNKAAILALGVIVGEEHVAEVAQRPVDLTRRQEISALRKRITLRGRNDLARHFWVSAALAVLSDEERSLTIGITKELMDANPGGSGFSFVDLMADRAGTQLAHAATTSDDSAHELQMRVREGLTSEDFLPEIEGLPEGITRDDFQSQYGGLGGVETGHIVQDIQDRLSQCAAIASSP